MKTQYESTLIAVAVYDYYNVENCTESQKTSHHFMPAKTLLFCLHEYSQNLAVTK